MNCFGGAANATMGGSDDYYNPNILVVVVDLDCWRSEMNAICVDPFDEYNVEDCEHGVIRASCSVCTLRREISDAVVRTLQDDSGCNDGE
jgi:hypothetical protein